MITQVNADLIIVYHLSVAVAKDTQSESKALDHIVIDVEDNSKSLFEAASSKFFSFLIEFVI